MEVEHSERGKNYTVKTTIGQSPTGVIHLVYIAENTITTVCGHDVDRGKWLRYPRFDDEIAGKTPTSILTIISNSDRILRSQKCRRCFQ